jgi:putative ABC transport system permease protein
MKIVGMVAGAIMALGATFASLNSLYAAVSARTREISILRAIGFSATPVVASVLIEAAVLALVGGLLGAALGWAIFDGRAMTSVGATYSQVAFRFAVTPALAATGIGVALSIGLLGGLPPALRAAHQRISEGLRALN